MKTGLRVQILLLIGCLLTLAFLPLYFAMSTTTEVALARSHAQAAQRLASATATWLAADPKLVASALHSNRAHAGHELGVDAVGVYASDGQLVSHSDGAPAEALPTNFHDKPRTMPQHSPWAVGRDQHEGVAVLVLVAPLAENPAPLHRLLALYMALIAGALLVAVSFTITAWIIRPLDQFSRAAKLFGSATHSLQLPAAHSREFELLAHSLQSMTEKLASEQSALLLKVDELQQARAQLERTQSQLVRSERLASVGQLAAGLAHEVGNPIAALQGMQDLILTGDLEPDQQLDFTRRMRKETERISSIIRDLLDFARPATPHSLQGEPGNIEAAVHETVALVAHQPALRDVDLAIDVHLDLPRVRLSHSQLTQVLLNLILNAAFACKDGGQIAIGAERAADSMLQLTVHDDGPGVPKELQDRIFEPFVSSKDVGEGSGLGLSVCRGLVEAAGGRIWLDTEAKSGARFVVMLPSSDRVSVS